MQKAQKVTKAAPHEVEQEGDLLDRTIALFSASARHIALLAAWIATSGSLFFSEVLHWQPCMLCWYQRILMYPLALILTVGIMRNDRGLHWYVLPLSITGILTSLYHYLLIKTDLFIPPACTGGVPCNVDYIDIFGFINIPFLALTAFTIITFMMLNYALASRGEDDEAAEPAKVSGAARATPPQLAALAIVGLTVATFVTLGLLVG
jgi:disulfide bond formation protein DsbB